MSIAPSQSRTRQRMPERPCQCGYPRECVYRNEGGGICVEPRVAKGNSDAACFYESPAKMLPVLTYVSQT